MIDLIQLHHGDCLEIMKQIPDGSVDMILTDPPYGTTACKWDTIIPFEPMWEQVWRVLKPNGACLLFGSEPFSSALRLSQIKKFKYDWIWEKSRSVGFVNAKLMPMKNHEVISVFSQKNTANKSDNMNYFPQGLKILNKFVKGRNSAIHQNDYGRPSHKKILFQEFTNYPKSVLKFNSVSKTVHPTQKPVQLLEYLIKTYTLEGQTVLDFTMGSGSTGVACVNINRKFIGIEKDDKYFEIATKRIHESR
jgi:site-specific DNA-methyltransferase (adenine-specific)